MSRPPWISMVFFLTLIAAGCGGNAASAPAAAAPFTSPPPPGGAPVGPANVVTVVAGRTTSAVDIRVPGPSSSPTPNAQDLGVAAMTGSASAFNTGDVIHRGSTARVLLFGPGLSGDMQVSINGPNDITISGVRSITATDNTPGVSFTATVAGNAALGARTVVLQNSQGDITTFTGGLEVVP